MFRHTLNVLVTLTRYAQIAARSDLMFAIFEWPLSALYVNTLLANLNARQYLRQGTSTAMEYHSGGTFELGTRGQAGTTGRVRPADMNTKATATQVSTAWLPVPTSTR